jgi:hypothetical protein
MMGLGPLQKLHFCLGWVTLGVYCLDLGLSFFICSLG